MTEDKLLGQLKKKMAICTILQVKFRCRCAKKVGEGIVSYQPFCEAVQELYNECNQ